MSPPSPWNVRARAAQLGGPNIQRPQPRGPLAAVSSGYGAFHGHGGSLLDGKIHVYFMENPHPKMDDDWGIYRGLMMVNDVNSDSQ